MHPLNAFPVYPPEVAPASRAATSSPGPIIPAPSMPAMADRKALEDAAAAVSSAWQRLGDLEAQILRERERPALLEAGLAATPEVKALESIEDFKRSDERKGIAAQVEISRSEIDLVTKRHQGQAGRARGLREAPEVMAEIGAAEPLG
jgi:hypothetical protein